MSNLIGQSLGDFVVVEQLGAGGMGQVFKARQPALNRFVALKVMSNALAEDREFIERFKREAATAAQFKHPNIVEVYTAGESNGTYYIAMDFVEGRTLREHIRSHGRLDPREAIAITLHVAEGLKYAWNKSQMIHRDIKPDNIFLSRSGEVLVGDLGLAKTAGGDSTELTASGAMMGSPHYISPEQALAAKEIDFRADIYSLGCTLFHMLTGRTAYQADSSMVLMMKHVQEPPPNIFEALPECPRRLGLMVARMLAKKREDRPPSYEELIAGLWEANESVSGKVEIGRPPAAQPLPATAVGRIAAVPTVVATPRKRTSPGMIYGAVGGAIVLLLAGLMIWSPWKSRTDEQGSREAAKPETSSASAQRSNTPSLQHSISTAAALKQLGNVFTNSVGAEMVYIPPGKFMLGSTKEEQAWAVANGQKEEAVRNEGEVTRTAKIKQGFWMGRTEVTVGQWKQFVKETGYVTDSEKNGESSVWRKADKTWGLKRGASWRDPDFGFEMRDDHPVSCASWNDAKAFCKWLNVREHIAGRLPQGYEMRLPTEAEWEYACRAGMQTKFWWGDSTEDCKGRLNWDGKEEGFEFVAPVDNFGTRGRNQFGLADMLGNVWEWCLDEYDEKQAHEEWWTGYPRQRVLRGGSFVNFPASSRCASRLRGSPTGSFNNFGFRICVGAILTDSARVASAPVPSALKDAGILAPPDTRVAALTTNPKVGEVFTLNVGSNVTMELMGIPPGEFMLGSTKEEQAWAVTNGLEKEHAEGEGEEPRKTTIKQGFWMGRTEVTMGQWKQFVKETGYVTDGEKGGTVWLPQVLEKSMVKVKDRSWRDLDFGFKPQDDHPVSCISWNDAKAFCKWLDAREQRAGRLTRGYAVRLPTEAEWEYACRAGMQTKFWWGDAHADGAGRLNWMGEADGFYYVALVDNYGERGRNRFGLADMLGNVDEWCLDEFGATKAHANFKQGDPFGRVVRGGAFNFSPARSRCAYRASADSSISRCNTGFRVIVGLRLYDATATTASTSSAAASKEDEVLAPVETRVSTLATNPKVGEVCALNFGSNVTMELMGIPPGEIMLGSTREERAWAAANGAKDTALKNEGWVRRKATIKQGFWMGRTEVTVGQWKVFVAATGYKTEAENKGFVDDAPLKGLQQWGRVDGLSWRDPGYSSPPQDNHPVGCISWDDAVAFCDWASERERNAGRLAANQVVRLPTEAEWEYACRAGTQTRFWWGDSEEGGKDRLNWHNRKGNRFDWVVPVDSFGPRGRNGFGLADMLGNVHEWVLDEFDAKQAHEERYKGNPSGRVLRGGSFMRFPAEARSASRTSTGPSNLVSYVGFRVIVGVDVSATPKEGGILAPPEIHVAALTTNPKVGEVFTFALGSNVTMELMGIPPGEFMFGSTKEEQAWAVQNGAKEENVKREGEAPRKATIKQGFWMGRTEVTAGQWNQFVKETGYVTDGEKNGESYVQVGAGKPWAPVKGVNWRNVNLGFEPRDIYPVSCISWNDALAFCEWLTEHERKTGRVPAGMVVRLPTETEWEYACRAGSQTKFWWGDSKEDGGGRLNWSGKDDGFEFVAPVDSFGQRGRNRLGLADMLGNVWEWCLDELDATQAHEDMWTGNPRARVLRGAEFKFDPAHSRCAFRIGRNPPHSDCAIGFRVAVGVMR